MIQSIIMRCLLIVSRVMVNFKVILYSIVHFTCDVLCFRISQLFAGLETVLSNSTLLDSVVDVLTDVNSLRSLVSNVRTLSNSCKLSILYL